MNIQIDPIASVCLNQQAGSEVGAIVALAESHIEAGGYGEANPLHHASFEEPCDGGVSMTLVLKSGQALVVTFYADGTYSTTSAQDEDIANPLRDGS